MDDEDYTGCVDLSGLDILSDMFYEPPPETAQTVYKKLSGESAEKCDACGGFTYGFSEAKWCCHCGNRLKGDYYPLLIALDSVDDPQPT